MVLLHFKESMSSLGKSFKDALRGPVNAIVKKTYTRPNCLTFKTAYGFSRNDVYKLLKDINFPFSNIKAMVEKKAGYIDITCKNREMVRALQTKLFDSKQVKNVRLYESDKVYVSVRWVPFPFPVEDLKSYLTINHGEINRVIDRHDDNGLFTGVYVFQMNKIQISENPLPSYIQVNNEEFFVKYNGQTFTCQFCSKEGHIAKKCPEKTN